MTYSIKPEVFTMLQPYIGARTREHFGTSRGGHTTNTYGIDPSGEISYRFNSLGFRCGEFSPDAKKKVFFCGCSNTFCVGLNEKESWPARFTTRFAQHHDLAEADVCMMNFSQAGCSNKYISRTLISQASRHRPDLMVAQFTYVGRTDFLVPRDWLDHEDPHMSNIAISSIGPWLKKPWLTHQLFLLKTPRKWRKMSRKVLGWVRWYYKNHSDQRAVYESLIDIALLQQYCRANSIPLILACLDHDKLRSATDTGNPALATFYDLLKPQLLPFALTDDSTYVDKAADGFHPGTRSHAIFAQKLWAHYLDQSNSNASA